MNPNNATHGVRGPIALKHPAHGKDAMRAIVIGARVGRRVSAASRRRQRARKPVTTQRHAFTVRLDCQMAGCTKPRSYTANVRSTYYQLCESCYTSIPYNLRHVN